MSIFNWKKKPTKQAQAAIEDTETILNEPQMLTVRLLFNQEPILDDEAINRNLGSYFKNFVAEQTDPKIPDTRVYVFKDYQVEFTDGTIPVTCGISPTKQGKDVVSGLENGLKQIWHWPEGKEKAKEFTHELLLFDVMTRTLNCKIRADIFQKFVAAVSHAVKPVAIYFLGSEKLVETETYLKNILKPGADYLFGLVNVRFFRIEENGIDTEREIMDTLGLHALGLPDFHIELTSEDPGRVVGLLLSYAHYVFKSGSVIKNENTVEGIEPGSKWRCVFVESRIEPKRNVFLLEQ